MFTFKNTVNICNQTKQQPIRRPRDQEPAAEGGAHASPHRWLIASCRQRGALSVTSSGEGTPTRRHPGRAEPTGQVGGNCCPHLKGMRNALVADLRRLGRRRQRNLPAGMEKRSYSRLGQLTCWLRRRRHHISRDLAGIMPDRSNESPRALLCTGCLLRLRPLQNTPLSDTLEER